MHFENLILTILLKNAKLSGKKTNKQFFQNFGSVRNGQTNITCLIFKQLSMMTSHTVFSSIVWKVI